jgi:uncharacterized small protein (DUF1192 family)
MRAYRARNHVTTEVAEEHEDPPVARLTARILELEEEVRHLKAELAKRPPAALAYSSAVPMFQPEPGFNTRPFTPVPKVRPSR